LLRGPSSDRLGPRLIESKQMNYNFEVKATIWDDNTYIERDLIPMWFDDETKNKIRQVVKEFYEGLSSKEIESYNKK
jgi:hypothetical protein